MSDAGRPTSRRCCAGAGARRAARATCPTRLETTLTELTELAADELEALGAARDARPAQLGAPGRRGGRRRGRRRGAGRPARPRRQQRSAAPASRNVLGSPSARCATPPRTRCAPVSRAALIRARGAARSDPSGMPPTRQTPTHRPPSLRELADEELMQLVRRATPQAFEVIYERHATAAFSLAYRMCGNAHRGRGRRPGGVPVALAQRRALRPHARQRPHVGARHRPQPRDRRAAPQRRPRPPARQRRGHRGALRGARAHGRRGARRDEAREVRQRARRRCRPSSCGSSSSRTSAASPTREIADDARHADRDGQGPDAAGPGEDATASSAGCDGGMRHERAARGMRRRRRVRPARARGATSADDYARHLATCALCRARGRRAAARSPTRCRSPRRVEPPPELCASAIMAVVEAEAELLRAAGAQADRPPERSERRRRSLGSAPLRPLTAGALACGPARRSGSAPACCSILATGPRRRRSPRRSPPSGATAEIAHDGDTRRARRGAGCPPRRAAASTRCGSSATARTPEPTDALFTVRSDGRASVRVTGDMDGADQVLVTARARGGSQRPDGDSRSIGAAQLDPDRGRTRC